MTRTARGAPIANEPPDLMIVPEPADSDASTAGVDVERDVVVRLAPAIRWVSAQAIYLGPTEPRIVLDIAPWDEE